MLYFLGSIVEAAFYSLAGQFLICFVLVPTGIIFAGYLIFIVVGVIKEIKKDGKK